MTNDFISGIMNEYDTKCSLYGEFTRVIEQLIRDLLKANNLRVHSITARVKDRQSLEDKLRRPDSSYEKLCDLTDTSGIRIITYFADEVDSIASIIKSEFEIDKDNSLDKRAILDPDRFGYLSLHYVANLSKPRLQLTEYKKYSECKVEIQIRSILQHTWAEIEHDLGYKNKMSIPRQLQRRFFQLAGHLELADELFTQLRHQIEEYGISVTEMVSKSPNKVQIDKDSLIAWYKNSTLIKNMDKKIVSATQGGLTSNPSYLADRVDQLYYAGFKTIAEVEEFAKKFESVIVDTAIQILGPKYEGNPDSGISLYYLSHVKILNDGDNRDLFGFGGYNKIKPKIFKPSKDDFETRLKKAYKSALSNKK